LNILEENGASKNVESLFGYKEWSDI